jgi:glycosyltransferase involved in cell wall biosynthesis
LRPIGPSLDCAVVFHSAPWRDGARAAGLHAPVMEVIPLGVQVPDDVAERAVTLPTPARLLWAGRLSPEKGLMLFVEALALVLPRRPVILTVIGAPGSDAYVRDVRAAIERLRLDDAVHMRPPVSRTEMIAEFGRHDLLLFHSIFAEPVAQVMLHAAAAGLPIVGPQSRGAGGLLRDGETAWCYASDTDRQIADAIVRALDAGEERRIRARALRAEVRRGHDLVRTIHEYDALLQVARGNPRTEDGSCLTARC